MSMVLDKPWQIRSYQLAVMVKRLEIEVNTGMHHSGGSTLKAVKQLYGVRMNTKKNALAEMLAFQQGWDVACDWSMGRVLLEVDLAFRQAAEVKAFKGRYRLVLRDAYQRGYEAFAEVIRK